MNIYRKVSIKKVFVACRSSVENRYRFTFTNYSLLLPFSKVYQMKFHPKVLGKFLLHIAVL